MKLDTSSISTWGKWRFSSSSRAKNKIINYHPITDYFYCTQVIHCNSGYFTFLVLCCICLALLNGFQTLSFLYLTYSPSFHIVKVEKICFYWVVLSGNFLKGLFLSATSLSR